MEKYVQCCLLPWKMSELITLNNFLGLVSLETSGLTRAFSKCLDDDDKEEEVKVVFGGNSVL